ncbi:MAG: energy-coupling factor transporter transmembrane component T family protein [Anaerolineae bacterium]
MENFEFLRNVTIGQYFQGDSIIHRLDPRAKITVLLILVVVNSFILSFTGNVLLLSLCIALVLLSGISFTFMLSGIKPALPLIAIFALMQLFFYGDAYPPYGMESITYWRWGMMSITNGSILLVIVTLMRFLEIFFLVSLLTSTTTTTNIAYAIENMLEPFQRLRLPAQEISLIGTIALRFVPIFAEQMEIIMKAQASRGADFGEGGVFQFVKRTRQMVTLIVPLFVDAFRRAEDLILAMDARCYTGGRGRTKIVRFRMTRMDYFFIALTAIFSILIMVFRNHFPV